MTIKTAVCCLVIIVFALALHAQDTQPATFETGKESDASRSASKRKSGVGLVDGKVIRVENGDTITVQADGQEQYLVKLQAIDAPDLGQPYYEESKNSLTKLIRGKEVSVVVHATGPSGVMIGTVYRNGRDVSLSLLERGLAWHYVRFPYQQTTANLKTYAEAQSIASAAGLGIWADASPVPPWVFRGDAITSMPGAAETSLAGGASDQRTTVRKYILGPRGGCYYVSESGSKVYVRDKMLCGVTTPEGKP
ncbi:MAG: thermonuclease family protein [Pyrinomonadaceae bacterium]